MEAPQAAIPARLAGPPGIQGVSDRHTRRLEPRKIGGLIAALMLARTDALFRDVTLEVVSPGLGPPGLVVEPEYIRENVEAKMRSAQSRLVR